MSDCLVRLSPNHGLKSYRVSTAGRSAGRDASDVDTDSVMLKAIDPTDGAVRHNINNIELQTGRAPSSSQALFDTNNDNVPDQLLLKFNRATVASWATGAPQLVLRVEGQFQTGKFFSGDTQIRIQY